MITATEYKLTCDNGGSCAARVRDKNLRPVGVTHTLKAASAEDARQKARTAGWVRRTILAGSIRSVRDLCPDCVKAVTVR